MFACDCLSAVSYRSSYGAKFEYAPLRHTNGGLSGMPAIGGTKYS
jgi:hypothetical protein